MDCSPPVSSVGGIPQARKLEWVAISYSMGMTLEKREINKMSPASLMAL